MPQPSLATLKRKAKRQGWADWIQSESDERAVLEGCYFDVDAALHVVRFIEENCSHSKGELRGDPLILADWQRDELIAPLYGWKRADGKRRYRKAYFSVPKKNGKSSLGSALVNYHLVGDGEPGPEVYIAAFDGKQAYRCYLAAAAMVRASTKLSNLIEPKDFRSRLQVRDAPECYVDTLSKDIDNAEGINASFILFDEVWQQRNRRLVDLLDYAGRGRRQPLTLYITTAGDDIESVGYELYEYAQGVIDGTVHDSAFFGLVYEADERDDWRDEDTWHKANPGLGTIIDLDAFRADATAAINKSSRRPNFKQKSLNLWVEPSDLFFDMEKWDRSDHPVDVEELSTSGRVCFPSIDLASIKDTTALTLFFPPRMKEGPDDPAIYLTWYWVPEEKLSRDEEDADRAPYRQWAKEGWLRVTPGAVTDYAYVRKDINELGERFKFHESAIGFDRWNAFDLMRCVEEDGFTPYLVGQGFRTMSPSLKRLEGLIIAGHFVTNANPVTRWQATRAKALRDAAENIKLCRRSSRSRIDGPVTMCMSTYRWMETGEKPAKPVSVYATRGMLTV